ncbi:HEAT repeat domain-containing protein [Singulisphaera sp. PoT]|uniref:HEAT repeat domain-containing protein n=1 Tax=Singulisphaera sp. PoT TaxID=3411797 RepID=UPI003BF4DC21
MRRAGIVDCEAATAAAKVLGSLGAEARSAVPALIEAARTRDKEDANEWTRRAAIVALGQIGPDARAAAPALRGLLQEDGEPSPYTVELLIALTQISPEGRELAERWLANPEDDWTSDPIEDVLERRARLLGALGRRSFESDRLVQNSLKNLDKILRTYPFGYDPFDGLEWWFEEIGSLGAAGRLALPRLDELRRHPSLGVRTWAKEAHDRIT